MAARYAGPTGPATIFLCALIASAGMAVSHGAEAFELKHTSHGQSLRWADSNVSYVVDPSVEKNVPGGAKAVSDAVRGWLDVSGGPTLSTTPGPGGAKPGVDGQNSVLFAPDGFAPAGRALAVTITSYDDSTGTIVDTDVVINGQYRFAVLGSDAKPDREASPVSTDGSSGDDGDDETPFDLVHVLSHEVGHTLGLADEHDSNSSLMYAYTMPGDPSVRVPSADDVDGVDALYGPPGSTPPGAQTRGGCGQASVAGMRSPADGGHPAGTLAVLGGACLWMSTRRRRRASRAVLPLAIVTAVACLAGTPTPALSAPALSAPALAKPGQPTAAADATARVVRVSTSNVGGLFETTLELTVTECGGGRDSKCPASVSAHAWGGTVGNITQRIGQDSVVPAVGDVVDVAFLHAGIGETGDKAVTADAPMTRASVLGLHRDH